MMILRKMMTRSVNKLITVLFVEHHLIHAGLSKIFDFLVIAFKYLYILYNAENIKGVQSAL